MTTLNFLWIFAMISAFCFPHLMVKAFKEEATEKYKIFAGICLCLILLAIFTACDFPLIWW